MTRAEFAKLQDALFEWGDGYPMRAHRLLEELAREAQEGFDAEDRYWSSVEAEAIPVNREAA